MEGLIAFAQDNLVFIIIAIIALLLVISLVKTVIKWVIVAVVVIGILVYGYNYDVDSLKDVGEKVLNYTKEEATQLLLGDLQSAQYEQNQDGTFTISSKNVKLEGKIGSNDAKITVAGKSFDIKIDQAIQEYIEKVKNR
jgi:hypothetical protein